MQGKDLVRATVQDAVGDFLYYDRKEDEALPRGEIERMIKAGELTVSEIVGWFEREIRDTLKAD